MKLSSHAISSFKFYRHMKHTNEKSRRQDKLNLKNGLQLQPRMLCHPEDFNKSACEQA